MYSSYPVRNIHRSLHEWIILDLNSHEHDPKHTPVSKDAFIRKIIYTGYPSNQNRMAYFDELNEMKNIKKSWVSSLRERLPDMPEFPNITLSKMMKVCCFK